MAIFRRDIPLWKKIVGVTSLTMLGITGICVAILENLTLSITTKELLETIAIRAFIIWWIGVIILAFHNIIYYRISKPAFSMYYTSIGILILVTGYLLSAFLPDWCSNFVIYLTSAISLILFFYDLLRFSMKNKIAK